MLIAIDFDGTFAADADLFHEFVDVAHERGHQIIIVTQRCPKYEPEVRVVVGPEHPIVWAAGQTKRAAAKRAGYLVDIWIDDNPESVSTPLIYRDCDEWVMEQSRG